MEVFLNAISYWLPETQLTNDMLNNEFPEWSVEKISDKTGINSRRIASTDEFVSDLAINAAEKLFAEYDIDRSSIDFILLCTQSPDYFLPTTACIVQDKLGLSKNAGALDFNLGCSGYVYGIGLAKGLIMSNSASKVLLITSETYSKFIHKEDKSNRTLFGDGASASIVSCNCEGFLVGDLVYGSDGKGANNLIVKNGGLKYRFAKGNDILDEKGTYKSNDDFLYMNGSEIFGFTSENVPRLVYSVLSKNNSSLESIDLFVFHQANKYMLDFIRRKIGIEKDRFFYYLENCGNTVSSTIPIALSEALKLDKINSNAKVLLAGFGVGYSWGGCILTKI